MHDRPVPRGRAAVLLAAAMLLVGGCAGDGVGRPSGGDAGTTVRTTSSSDPLGVVEIPEPPGRDERLQIGLEATRGLDAFVASDRTVMGERTVVDLTRTPFLAMTAFTVSTEDVERTERRDDARGVLTITLRNRTGVKTVYSALPKVEIGGLLFIGIEELVLNYALRTDRARPIRLHAVATGNAVYRSESPARKDRGSRVTLDAEVRGTGDAARFASDVRVDP